MTEREGARVTSLGRVRPCSALFRFWSGLFGCVRGVWGRRRSALYLVEVILGVRIWSAFVRVCSDLFGCVRGVWGRCRSALYLVGVILGVRTWSAFGRVCSGSFGSVRGVLGQCRPTPYLVGMILGVRTWSAFGRVCSDLFGVGCCGEGGRGGRWVGLVFCWGGVTISRCGVGWRWRWFGAWVLRAARYPRQARV